MSVTPELAAVLNKFGREPGYSTCECETCHRTRVVEKKITAGQALHTIMGQSLADGMIDDMGPDWTIVAALCDPRGDGTPARAALVAMVDAGVSFKRRKRCECGATCQDIGGGRCRYERDLPNQRQK